ncbi:hypothetical protein [Thermotalea metallivorans]|uniref:Uncharacterized protein n=1 Tax=Thermotalea metallivorans TaxID=520762 RepID=A0A140L3B9_9FIRM|nr:hypothetical protein [Thermotalea metallivorans]KXG75044.1 hypothetical protein AN619_20140 [Thermotalea metallivorans]
MSDQSQYIYRIQLPAATSKDVVEWFEMMNANERLSDELIYLVHNSLKKENLFVKSDLQHEKTEEIQDNSSQSLCNQEDFFHNLYNWQDSNNHLFQEDNTHEEKKTKKKMLSI